MDSYHSFCIDLAEDYGLEPQIPFSIAAFQEQFLIQPDVFQFIVVPQGFEPRLFWTKTRRVANYTIGHYKANMSKNFFFWGFYQIRTDDSGLQSRGITNYTKKPI